MERRVYGLLEDQGHLFPDPSIIEREDYRKAYQWMALQMEARLRPPLPGCPAWPMWAWIKYDGFEVPAPFERRDEHVVVSMKFHPSDVLLSTLGHWEDVLNNFIVPNRLQSAVAQDDEYGAFLDKCVAAGVEDWHGPLPGALQEEAEATWSRIFDVQPDDVAVQAAFYAISAENIVEVRPWDAPRARRRRIIEVPQQDALFLSQTA
jgi:hypothetical protein